MYNWQLAFHCRKDFEEAQGSPQSRAKIPGAAENGALEAFRLEPVHDVLPPSSALDVEMP